MSFIGVLDHPKRIILLSTLTCLIIFMTILCFIWSTLNNLTSGKMRYMYIDITPFQPYQRLPCTHFTWVTYNPPSQRCRIRLSCTASNSDMPILYSCTVFAIVTLNNFASTQYLGARHLWVLWSKSCTVDTTWSTYWQHYLKVPFWGPHTYG